jgi:hypothetical protein
MLICCTVSDSELKLGLNEPCSLQQDNGTKHIAMATWEWLLHHFRHLLQTSSQLLDLNKMENYDTCLEKGDEEHKTFQTIWREKGNFRSMSKIGTEMTQNSVS